jgi:uncharacterized membrane protein YraQ (UPF0718 family)
VEEYILLFVNTFVGLLYEALPFIVAGAWIGGIVEEFVPRQLLARMLHGRRLLGILVGGLMGILNPTCDCAALTVIRRLLRKGVPLSSCVSFLLAAPIINVLVMISTFDAFSRTDRSPNQQFFQLGGAAMLALRMGFGYLIAITTSLIVDAQYRKHGNKLLNPLAVPAPEPADNGPAPRKSIGRRLSNIAETALHDFVDVTVFLIIGAALAALLKVTVSREFINGLVAQSPMIVGASTILIMMALAVVLCICSQADAFYAASFTMLPPASKLAFMLVGPMLDLKLYSMYTRVFRPRLLWTIILCVVTQVFVYSMLTHIVLENLSFLWTSTAP